MRAASRTRAAARRAGCKGDIGTRRWRRKEAGTEGEAAGARAARRRRRPGRGRDGAGCHPARRGGAARMPSDDRGRARSAARPIGGRCGPRRRRARDGVGKTCGGRGGLPDPVWPAAVPAVEGWRPTARRSSPPCGAGARRSGGPPRRTVSGARSSRPARRALPGRARGPRACAPNRRFPARGSRSSTARAPPALVGSFESCAGVRRRSSGRRRRSIPSRTRPSGGSGSCGWCGCGRCRSCCGCGCGECVAARRRPSRSPPMSRPRRRARSPMPPRRRRPPRRAPGRRRLRPPTRRAGRPERGGRWHR